MALNAFISYAHADEKYLERLHKHLAMLLRDGTLSAWSDHKILPGGRIGAEIDGKLNESGLFIAMVSPDYLSSNYCYEKEFQVALALAEAGKIRIVPIILEPCDWLSSPFNQFLALPKDGKPISDWVNQNNAYLDVVTGLRRVVMTDAAERGRAVPGEQAATPVRRVKVKQEFDVIQRSDFADQAFAAIRSYFQKSCAELNGIEDLKAKFEAMSDTAFTCTVVNRGIKGGRDAHITMRNDKGRSHFGDISYVYQPHGPANTSNGGVHVAHDDYNLYLTMNGFMGGQETKYDAQQAAEVLWLDFVGQAGITYA